MLILASVMTLCVDSKSSMVTMTAALRLDLIGGVHAVEGGHGVMDNLYGGEVMREAADVHYM